MNMQLEDVRAAKAGDVLKDDKERGLQLRAFVKKKVWYFYYSTRTGAQRKPKIGVWPSVTIDQARGVAKIWRAIVTQGGDPSADIKQGRDSPTMKDFSETYMTRYASKRKKPRSIALDRHNLNKTIIPFFGLKRVNEVTSELVEQFMERNEDHPIKANRCRQLLSKMFNLSIKWKLRTDNPVTGSLRYPEKGRKRYLSKEEYVALINALNVLEGQYRESVAVIKVLMLTGARLSEIILSRREWLRNGILYLPDSKTGEKEIMLPTEALEIIRSVEAKDGWLCGIGIRPTPCWKKVCKIAGLKNLHIHDLRHSFASVAISNGYTLAQIGELLGHKSAQTTKRYAHLVDELRERAVNSIAESIIGN